jgi:hypothetical protein
MHRICDALETLMKTATLPSLRVAPELRGAIEELLEEGESLSGFVEQSIQEHIDRRRMQAEFIRRGLLSRDKAREAQQYVGAEQVVGRLETLLVEAKAGRRSRA